MAYELIQVGVDDGVMTITMNRPERLNAWTPDMGGEMAAAIESANADDSIEAIVVTGAGRGFCAGADIEAVFKARADGDEAAKSKSGARSSTARDWVGLMRRSKPIVAAINGAAIGVGLTQVLPMDQLIASEGAKLSVRFIKMGLVPELASSHFLALRCGFGNASDLMLTGRTITAAEAKAVGLVDRVVPADQLLSEATACAKAMGSNPQSALRMVKELLTLNAAEPDLALVQKRELGALVKCYASPEHKEAIAAFLEKRDPDFKSARASQ